MYESLIDELIAIGRDAVERGLVLASGGNLSARSPGAEKFIITRAGSWLDRLRPEDFAVVSVDGELLTPEIRPSSEWKLHQRTYRQRADVNSVIHVHPQHAVLVDALGEQIRLLTLDHAYYVRSIGVVPFHPNGSEVLANLAAAAAEEHNCVILSHHGCSALGENTSMAFRRALNLEEAAVMTYRCLAVGNTTATFPPEAFEELHHES